jgi:hypothetical protein
LVRRHDPESPAVVTALMVTMLLAGLAVLVLVGQAIQAPASRSPRLATTQGEAATPADGAMPPVEAPSATVAPAVAELPSPAPPPPAIEELAAHPALAIGAPAQVANTDTLGVVLHAAPRTGARTPTGLLEGARVTLVEVAGEEWARVRSAQGQVGWVPTAYLAPAE